jgi:hypothetical protein
MSDKVERGTARPGARSQECGRAGVKGGKTLKILVEPQRLRIAKASRNGHVFGRRRQIAVEPENVSRVV